MMFIPLIDAANISLAKVTHSARTRMVKLHINGGLAPAIGGRDALSYLDKQVGKMMMRVSCRVGIVKRDLLAHESQQADKQTSNASRMRAHTGITHGKEQKGRKDRHGYKANVKNKNKV